MPVPRVCYSLQILLNIRKANQQGPLYGGPVHSHLQWRPVRQTQAGNARPSVVRKVSSAASHGKTLGVARAACSTVGTSPRGPGINVAGLCSATRATLLQGALTWSKVSSTEAAGHTQQR
jgi:hypothetical protein